MVVRKEIEFNYDNVEQLNDDTVNILNSCVIMSLISDSIKDFPRPWLLKWEIEDISTILERKYKLIIFLHVLFSLN